MNPFINRMRGILAILVVIWHIAAIAFAYPTTQDVYQSALAPLVMFTGFNYVIGFIVVSGYCIARSALARNSNFSLLQYTALRVTRIYPLLIVCACIVGVVELVFFGRPSRIAVWDSGFTLHNFVASLLGMSGFYGQFGSYAPSYTVSYELLFYLIWGVVFALTPTSFAVPVSLLAGVCLYFVLPLTYSFALVLFAVWLIGAALAVHEHEIIKITRRVPLWLMWVVVLCAYISGNAFAALKVSIWSYPGSLITIPCGLLFGIIMACHLSKRGKALQVDGWLGDISYPLFLAHGPVMMGVASALKATGTTFSFGTMFAILMGCCILAAQAVLVVVERPVMRMRRRLSAALAQSKNVSIEIPVATA